MNGLPKVFQLKRLCKIWNMLCLSLTISGWKTQFGFTVCALEFFVNVWLWRVMSVYVYVLIEPFQLGLFFTHLVSKRALDLLTGRAAGAISSSITNMNMCKDLEYFFRHVLCYVCILVYLLRFVCTTYLCT
jgi:hypothetical protein